MKKEHCPRHYKPASPLKDNVLSLFSVITVIAGTLAVVALILWLLWQADILKWNSGMFDPSVPGTEQGEDAPSVYDFLREDAPTSGDHPTVHRVKGDFSAIRTILTRDKEQNAAYYLEAEASLGTGQEQDSTRIRLWKDGEDFCIRRTGTRGTDSYVRIDDTVAYTDPAGQVTHFPATENFSMEALAGLPSADSFAVVADEDISSAAWAEIDGETVCYAAFRVDTGMEHSVFNQEYWISAKWGIVVRCRTYIGASGAPAYRSNVTTLRPLTETERLSVFVLPKETAK